ncbi:MAG TPA: hypothetical protein VJS11_06435 [Acidobacteriaceae bacterium]|nr:hypothetical protein [Acidobacteriaceae bacterium]
MTSKLRFFPLCDLHHTPMRRMMLEEYRDEVRTFHGCDRRDCSRVFREASGYVDWIDGEFDESRASLRRCPTCGAILYLAEVDQSRKIETWECAQVDCGHSEEFASPSAR